MPRSIAVVGADAELAEAAGALVGVEQLDQELLAALGAGVDDLAGLEAQAHAGDLAAADHGRQVEGDLALDRVLDRAGEELAVGHVVLADAGDELAAGDAELDVGAGGGHADLLAPLDPLGQARGLLRGPLPGGQRVGVGRRGRRRSRSPRSRRGSSPPPRRRRWSGRACSTSGTRPRRCAPSPAPSARRSPPGAASGARAAPPRARGCWCWRRPRSGRRRSRPSTPRPARPSRAGRRRRA